MKLLHLSDLHIGKVIYEQSLLEDQKYMLDEIIKIISKKKVEGVLISGDVYDRSVPPAEAVETLNDFLNVLIKELKIQVFIIAGNHDSKERLSFGSKIFESDGLYIQANYEGNIKKVVLEDKKGTINIYMLPFVKPIEVKKYFPDKEIGSYNDAIKLIMENEELNIQETNILMSHQFVTSGLNNPETCESETINVGGSENVDISNFDKFDYVALGHIHGPQRIGKDTIRYSGTMLKYSFSEVNHNKSAVLLDIQEKNNIKFELVPLVPLRDMREIKGPIEELVKKENYETTNTDDYIRAIITNEEPVYDPIGQIRKVYPNTLSLEVKNSKTISENFEFEKLEAIKAKSELELFDDFYEFQNNVRLNDSQKEILEKVIASAKK